jgi:hypothetical protein
MLSQLLGEVRIMTHKLTRPRMNTVEKRIRIIGFEFLTRLLSWNWWSLSIIPLKLIFRKNFWPDLFCIMKKIKLVDANNKPVIPQYRISPI